MTVELVTRVSDELVKALQNLVPQLTGKAENITSEFVESIVNTEGVNLFIARKDDRTIIGTLSLVIFTIPTSKKGFIEDVVVDVNAQGFGAGRALMESAISYAKCHGVTRIELSSNPSRIAANRLYKKIGFEVRETNFYRMQL